MGVAHARYHQFVNDGKAEGHNAAFYGGQADSRIVGEEDFVKAILNRNARRRRAPTIAELVTYPSLSSRASVRLPSPHKLHVEQISPNKNMSLQCTTAAFTLSAVPSGFVIWC